MSQEIINVGSAPNDGSGDPIRTAFIKCNDNFTELYDIPGKSLANGTSSITIDYSANVNINVSNIADLAVFTSSGLMVQNSITTANLFATNIVNPVYTNDLSVTGQIFVDWLDANANPLPGAGIVASVANIYDIGEASSYFGNIYVGNVLTNQISSSGNIYAGNISVLGNITGNILFENQVSVSGNILSGGLISAAGDVIGSNIVTAGVVTATGNVIGSNIVTAGVITATGNIYTAGYFVGGFSGSITGNVTASGSNTDIQYNDSGNLAGSSGFTFDQTNNSVSISGNTTSGNFLTAGLITATGNITGGNLLTAGYVTATGNITGSNLLTSGLITATGNITGGNINTAGINSVAGNTTSGNFLTAGLVTATGNIIGGNLVTSGINFVAGNIIGGNINTVGLVSATGNIAGGNLLTSGLITATGNITGGNINTAGYVTATGNISTAGYFNGIFVGSISGNITAPGSNTQIVYNNSGNLSGSTGFTFNQSTNAVSISGNTTSGNFLTAGVVSATGNIIGGNLLTAGISSVAGNIYGNNINTTGVVSATGNITGGNLLTAGLISATGNITGNFILGNGSQLTGIVSASSFYANGLIGNTLSSNVTSSSLTTVGNLGNLTVVGNTTSGNLLSAGQISLAGNVTANNFFFNGSGNVLGNLNVQGNITFINSNVIVTNDLYFELANNQSTYANINGAGIQAGNTGTVSLANWTYNYAANAWVSNLAISALGNVAGANITTIGLISSTGNVVSGNIITSGLITATGNISTAGYFVGAFSGSISGNVTAPGSNTQIVYNNSGNLSGSTGFTFNQSTNAMTLSGNATSANFLTAGLVSATGNVIGNYIIGNGSQLTSLTGANITGQVANALIAGTVTTNAQPNITSVGTLTSITSSGLISTTGNVVGNYHIGNGSQLTSLTGTNVTGQVANALIAGTVYTNAQPNITSVGTLTSITSSGLISTTGNVVGSNLSTAGTVYGASLVGTTISASGNVYVANLSTSGTVYASIVSVTGTITDGAAFISGNAATGTLLNITDYAPQGSSKTVNIIGGTNGLAIVANITNGDYNSLQSSGDIALLATGANIGNVGFSIIPWAGATSGIKINTVSNVTTITLAATTLSITGNVTTGVANIAAGNISVTGNVTGNYFVGTATHALYADLAECYRADDDYAPGTVVSFGGDEELTMSRLDSDTTVAGVISTDPAYLMNSNLKSTYVAKLALTGRTPCQVQGSVTKGAMMISAGNGRARAESNPKLGSVIGKALESFNGDFGTIEIVVGRL